METFTTFPGVYCTVAKHNLMKFISFYVDFCDKTFGTFLIPPSRMQYGHA